jgi:hypothetical protein
MEAIYFSETSVDFQRTTRLYIKERTHFSLFVIHLVKEKGKVIPVTDRGDPYGCETSRLPHFLYTIGSQMAVKLSVLCPGRPLPSGRFLVLIFVRG